MEDRSPLLQQMLDILEKEFDIDPAVVEGSDHPYECRCDYCRVWWALCGPVEKEDGNPKWGPFSAEEIEAFKRERGIIA